MKTRVFHSGASKIPASVSAIKSVDDAHDGAHRLTGVTFPWHKSGSSGPSEKNTLSYFANNWLNISANSRIRATYSYDARGFLSGLSNTSVTMGTSLATFNSLTYDAAGNRGGFNATMAALNGPDYDFSHTLAYTYDQRDELTEEKSTAYLGNDNGVDVYDQTFGFDLAYNRTGYEDMPPGNPFSYMFNPDNQNNGGGFTYDGSGNPTQYNSSASTYAYDPEQRLTGIGGTFTAHYDGDGMRDYTTVNGTTTYYIYDGASPVLEETYSGTTATIQVANGMADGWRERYAATSAGFNAYGFDPQGSLTVEDSSFNTTLPAQNVYVYDGYGNRLVGERVSNGSTTAFNIDPVQFGGQYGYYTDTSTGEVQLTHRYYDASTGHFLNRDPIGYNGGQNLYTFCNNNPINYSDPNGTRDEVPADEARFAKLRSAAASSDVGTRLTTVRPLLEGCIKVMKAQIAASKGKDDTTDPARLRATWWAIDRLGSGDYSQAGTLPSSSHFYGLGKHFKGESKCNAFVSDAYGAVVGYDGISWGNPFAPHPPGANVWGDSSQKIKHFNPLGHEGTTGDVTGFADFGGHGHSAIYLGNGVLIYASTFEIKIGDVATNQSGHSPVVYRRYSAK